MTTHTICGTGHGQLLSSFRDANTWMVRSRGHMVGPVSIDLIERGLSAGKIPGDAEMAHMNRNEWFAVARYQAPCTSLPQVAPQPVPPPPPSFRFPEEPVTIPKQRLLASLFG